MAEWLTWTLYADLIKMNDCPTEKLLKNWGFSFRVLRFRLAFFFEGKFFFLFVSSPSNLILSSLGAAALSIN